MAEFFSRYVFKADTKQYQGEVEAAAKSTDGLSKSQKGVGKASKDSTKSMEKLSKSVNAGREKLNAFKLIVGAAGTAMAVALVKNGLSSVDALAKTSDKLGIAINDLAAFRLAGEKTGVATKTMDVALQRFTRRLQDASEGAGPAVKAFDALGLSANELVKLSPDEALGRVADEMNKVGSQTEKVSLAFKLFDSEGVALVNTLALGSAGLSEMAEEAEILGLTLSRVDAAKVEAANDAMKRISNAVQGLGRQMAVQMAPLLEAIAEKFYTIAKEAGGMGEVATEAFSMIMKAAGFVGDAFAGIARLSTTIGVAAIEGAKLVIKGLDAIARFVSYTPQIWLAMKLLGIVTGEDYSYKNSAVAKYVDELELDIGAAADYIASVWQEPIPSDQIEKFVNDVKRQYEKLETTQNRVADNFTENNKAFVESAKAAAKAQAKSAKAQAKSAKDLAKAQAKAADDAAKALEKSAKEAARAQEKVWLGARDTLSGFFFEFAAEGNNAFDTLFKGFKALIAKMIAEAAANRVIISVGAALGGGSASAAAAGGLTGGGGYTGLLSSLTGAATSGFTGLGGAYTAVGNSNLFSGTAYGNAALDRGREYAYGTNGGGFTNLGLNIGAGFAGNWLAGKAFKETSGVGSAVGGLAGSPFGPLGTGAGAFLGAGLEKALGDIFGFGNSKPGQNAGYSRFDLGAGTNESGGYGKNFNAENVTATEALTETLQRFANSIGGSSFAGQVDYGDRSGIKFDGVKYGDDIDAFLIAAFDQILDSATNLTPALKEMIQGFDGTADQVFLFAESMVSMADLIERNSVADAVKDFASAQEDAGKTLTTRYQEQSATLFTLLQNFDGSAAAAAELNTELLKNKTAAYDLAMAIQVMGKSITDAANAQATSIRESLLSEDELRSKRVEERNSLRRELPTLTDPEKIAASANRILELNNEIFNSLSEAGQKYQGENFAEYAEDTGTAVENLYKKILADNEQSQDAINNRFSRALSGVAVQQQTAADTMVGAANTFQSVVNNLQSQGIRVTLETVGGEVNV